MAFMSRESAFAAARPLAESGMALHWLRPGQKAPIREKWSTAPRHSVDTLIEQYSPNANLGIRLGEVSETAFGYLHLIDLDIRDPNQAGDAWAEFRRQLPELDLDHAPTVISGSGGESRHFYFTTRQPLGTRKLAWSEGFDLVYDERLKRNVRKRHWEIELCGSGKQAVLPPSIHPDTGLAYQWKREFNFPLLSLVPDMIMLPDEAAERLGVEQKRPAEIEVEDDDDGSYLDRLRAQSPVDPDEAEIDRVLDGLPEEWVEDRHLWFQAGMALHHQYQGGRAGFEKWCEWSKQSNKFDRTNSVRVWKSFKGREHPVSMRSLIQAANQNALVKEHDFDVEDQVDPDETGTPGEPEPARRSPEAIEPMVEVDDPEWRRLLHLNQQGGIRSTLHNVALIVRNDPRLTGMIHFNEMKEGPVQRTPPKFIRAKKNRDKPACNLTGSFWTDVDPTDGIIWTDTHDAGVRRIIEAPTTQGGYSIKVSQRDLKDAVNIVARERTFHPVRDAVLAVEWDGGRRVETFFIDHLGCPDTLYHRETATKFLLAMITRLYEP